MRINSRLSKKDMFDYNCATCIKNLGQIHDFVLLVEDEIMTGIIVFDDILFKECAHIEEISRGIYGCGGSVQRGPWKVGKSHVWFSKGVGQKSWSSWWI